MLKEGNSLALLNKMRLETILGRKPNLVYEAYASLLKRIEEFDEQDWERAGRFEKHAMNASLDFRDLLAKYELLDTENKKLLEILKDANT